MSRPTRRRSPISPSSTPGPHGAVDLLRRRHAVADGSALGRRHPRHHRQALEHRSKGRDHARGQPDLGRGRPLPRLPRRRRQPRLARRAVAARRPARRARPPPQRRRSDPRRAARAVDLSALELRSHLCPPAPDARRLGRRADRGALAGAGASVALPADHRDGHALLRPVQCRQAQDAGRGSQRRFLRADAGTDPRGRPAGLRDFQPRPAGPGDRSTTSSTGAMANMPASARARMAAC